jgi:hypothetical protein
MTPGETARTVNAMLEADLRGDLTEQAVLDLMSEKVDLATLTSMFGCAVAMFTALAERDPLAAREVLDGHRAVSYSMD